MKLRIVHVDGSKAGQTQDLAGPVVMLGRDPSCQVQFDPVADDRASSRHAQLTVQGNSIILTDLGSKNGTLVNGKRISQPMLVQPNALVQLGDNGGPTIMAKLIPDAPAAAPEPPPAPPPPPPPPPAKSKAPLVIGCLLVLMLLCCVGGGLLYWFKYREQGETTTAKGGDGEPKGGEDKKPDAKEEKKPEKKPNGWAKLPVGTIIETKTVSKVTVPKMETESITTYTLKDRDDNNATVMIETKTKAQGKDLPAVIKDQQFPLFEDPTAALQKDKPTESKDSIEVKGAGKIACTKYTVRSTAFGVEKSRTETWLDAKGEIPVPIKYVYQTMANNTTVTMTKIQRPGDPPPK